GCLRFQTQVDEYGTAAFRDEACFKIRVHVVLRFERSEYQNSCHTCTAFFIYVYSTLRMPSISHFIALPQCKIHELPRLFFDGAFGRQAFNAAGPVKPTDVGMLENIANVFGMCD